MEPIRVGDSKKDPKTHNPMNTPQFFFGPEVQKKRPKGIFDLEKNWARTHYFREQSPIKRNLALWKNLEVNISGSGK